jgi:isopentenyl-diphosphate delta-isomerase
VILVDRSDRALGSAPKLEAHERGELHRAFSVFVLNARGELLLQRRAGDKYHSGGLWSNTCCGHPRPGEETASAAARRLREEMGFGCELRHLGRFTYRAELGDGLVEHEVDHVFAGRHDGDPRPDPREVEAWRWVSPEALREEIQRDAGRFTPWLAAALDQLEHGGHGSRGQPPTALRHPSS